MDMADSLVKTVLVLLRLPGVSSVSRPSLSRAMCIFQRGFAVRRYLYFPDFLGNFFFLLAVHAEARLGVKRWSERSSAKQRLA